MRTARRPIHSEDASSLAEVMVAVALLGIGFMAVIGGLDASIRVTHRQRAQVELESVTIAFADALQRAVYEPCPGLLTPLYHGAFAAPSGYTAEVTVIEAWAPPDAFGACAVDTGVQRITVHVRSATHDVDRTLVLVKRVV